MHRRKMIARIFFGLVLISAAIESNAGQTPGVSTPWNGPWGGGYLNGESYAPWSNPYVSAGNPVAGPYGNGGNPGNMGAPAPQPQYLPGGGYILPPGAGGGMLPGAYTRQ